jgi:hypothetical protein
MCNVLSYFKASNLGIPRMRALLKRRALFSQLLCFSFAVVSAKYNLHTS